MDDLAGSMGWVSGVFYFAGFLFLLTKSWWTAGICFGISIGTGAYSVSHLVGG